VKDNIRGQLCQALAVIYLQSFSSSYLLDTLVSSLYNSINSNEIISQTSYDHCSNILISINNLVIAGYMTSSHDQTLDILAETISIFIDIQTTREMNEVKLIDDSINSLISSLFSTIVPCN
jgi:hypothetical protein